MTREDFKRLYDQALNTAADNAEKILGRPVPRHFEIELHGKAPNARTMSIDAAFEEIFLSPGRTYRVIDVGLKSVGRDTSRIFMSISGHEPGRFADAWNDPAGTGPFKQIIPNSIEFTSD